jgi:hypothetical protein
MASHPPAAQSLTATQEAEAIAPSSLRGWGALQRSYNVTLPYQLRRANALLREAQTIMAGKGG